MHAWVRRFMWSAAVLGLAACGGNPLVMDAPTPFGPISTVESDALVAAYDTQTAAVLALAPTAVSGAGTTGQATYTGLTQMTVAPEGTTDTMVMVGEVTFHADFDDLGVTAQMSNFAGPDLNGTPRRLDGSLTMDAGQIGSTEANTFAGVFYGTLVADNFELTSRGILDGTFRGTPASALSFSGLDDAASLDGTAAQLTLTGVATD